MLDIIVRNSARCLDCGDEIESLYGHDFRYCSCGQVAVDGGLNYTRRVYKEAGRWQDTSIFADQPPTDFEIMESIALVQLVKGGGKPKDSLWEHHAPILNDWHVVDARVPPGVDGQHEIEGDVWGHQDFVGGQRIRTNAVLLTLDGVWIRTTSRFFRLGIPAAT